MAAEILSVRLDGLSYDEVISRLKTFLTSEKLHHVIPVNPEFIMATRHDSELLKISNAADLTIPDGVGLRFAAKVLRIEVGRRIPGVDLTWEVAKIASDNSYSIFFLGAAEGIAAKAAERLKKAYPALRIAGTDSGTPDENGLVDRINNSEADILLVAFGVPKQEKFVYENKNRLTPKIAMSVGGTFDFIAGVVPRAPAWMRSAGIEWLYRLIKQPQRINRIFTATVRFPVTILISIFLGRKQVEATERI